MGCLSVGSQPVEAPRRSRGPLPTVAPKRPFQAFGYDALMLR